MKVFKIAVLLTLVFIGCKAEKETDIRDRAGNKVTINKPINRIISTAPSNTEIIAELGKAHKLVAIDRHSVNVKAPAGDPAVPDGLPLLDFFYPDAEAIIGLEPDIIIASGHNPTGSGADPFRLLSETGIAVVYIPMSKSIEDIYKDIAFIADLLDVQEKGNEVIKKMKEKITEITQKINYSQDKKKIYFEISPTPQIMTFGRNSFINDMISVIGGQNIFENENWLISPAAEAIISRNPDVILTNVNYIDDPAGEIKNRPGFNHINAVKNNQVYYIDNDSSVRPSPKIILALEQMAQAIYPEGY